MLENLRESKVLSNFALAKPREAVLKKGAMSEWLGTGLQNRLHQFESGWHLKMKKISFSCNSAEVIFFFFCHNVCEL